MEECRYQYAIKNKINWASQINLHTNRLVENGYDICEIFITEDWVHVEYIDGRPAKYKIEGWLHKDHPAQLITLKTTYFERLSGQERTQQTTGRDRQHSHPKYKDSPFDGNRNAINQYNKERM